MARYSRAKDFHYLLTTLDSFTAGQASLVEFDSDCLTSLSVMLTPTGGLYAGGKYVFEVRLMKTKSQNKNIQMFHSQCFSEK